MVADPIKPTREELARIVGAGDYRGLRAWERLFEVAGEELPNDIDTIRKTAQKNETFLAALNVPSVDKINELLRPIKDARIVFVGDRFDFPKASAGVITLEDDTVYLVFCEIDLEGDRIVCPDKNSLFGYGTDISRILSTGLTGTALLTTTGTLTLQSLAIEADIALDMSGSAGDFID